MGNILTDDLPSLGLIDSHFHASMLKKRNLDPVEIIRCIFDAGYAALLDIGTDADDFNDRFETAKQFEFLYMTVGLYPSNCENTDVDGRIESIRTLLSHPKVIGIGEIGLDYHWDYGTRDSQRNLLLRQLDLASSHNLPVCIHNREADEDVAAILREARPDAGVVIHCFSSDKTAVRNLLDNGCHISFAGNMTFANAGNIREALSYVPVDRLLLETDSPYLAPQNKRGRPNHPGYIQYIYEFAAAEKKTGLHDLIFQLKQNFKNIFKVPLQE